jgi:hypothetical protein
VTHVQLTRAHAERRYHEADIAKRSDTRMASPTAHSAGDRKLTVCLSGTGVRISGLPDALYERLWDLLAPFVNLGAVAAKSVRVTWQDEPPMWLVDSDGATRHGFRDEVDLLTYLEWRAASYAAEANTGYALFHAAALTKDEMTLLLVGESGAGKTTATVGLIQRGWLPLSDDSAFVSLDSLAVVLFPRCFHVDDFTASTIESPELFAAAGSVAGRLRPAQWAATSARVTCIVRLARDSAAPTSAQPITQAEAAGVLLESAIGPGVPKRAVAPVSVAVAADARSCWRVNNGEVRSAIDLLERLAASSNGS